ncbi:MAG TPA: hypothetical protein VLT59_07095 [Steroidobacteraceae bacterium]|nr:hypothetical protein [Steroidobacteraceae bacterium]
MATLIARADTRRSRRGRLLITMAIVATGLAGPSNARMDTADAHVMTDPRLAPLIPVLQQCVERRSEYRSATEFFRTAYGTSCAAVMLSFGLVTEAELAQSWER